MGFRTILPLILLTLTGCNLLDEPELQPSYLNVETVTVKDPDGNGIVSHAITDLWSYLDGANLGVYPHPTHIACLPQTESSTVSFIAGIRENGIASSVSTYPMMEHLDFEINLEPGVSYPLNPEFRYRSDVIFRFDEGFESTANLFSFDADGDPNSNLLKNSEKSVTGTHSGVLIVPDTVDFVEIATADAYLGVPTDGTSVYLELDYTSEADVFIGLIGYQDAQNLTQPLKSYYLGLIPNEDWQKIYVNLTEPLFDSDLEAYRILIRAENNGTGNVEKVYFDNLKLLHF